jgi:hypothetical protein
MVVRVWHLGLLLFLVVLLGGYYVTHGSTPSGAAGGGADQGSTDVMNAEANLRSLAVSIESYVADNTPHGRNDPDRNHSDSGYTGMTIAIVRNQYDKAIPSFDWVDPSDPGYPAGVARVTPTKSSFCAISKSGSVYAWQLGPKGAIKTSTNVALVCRS